MIYYLVLTLDNVIDNERQVELTLQTLLIPLRIALNPLNPHSQASQFIVALKKVDVGVHELKIASIRKRYKDNEEIKVVASDVLVCIRALKSYQERLAIATTNAK